MLLTATLLALSVLPSNALFWGTAPASPQAPLFQPPQPLGGYVQPSNGYDTAPPTTTTALPPPPPLPVLPTACTPPPPPPIQFPVLHLNEPYAQPTLAPLPTLPPPKPFEFPTLPPPKPFEFPTLPPPKPFPTLAELFPPPASYPQAPVAPASNYAVAPPVFVATTTTQASYAQPKESYAQQPASIGIPPPPEPTPITVRPPAVEQSGY